MNAYLVEAVDQRVWWPYRAGLVSVGMLDSMWFIADADEDAQLLKRMSMAWENFTCLAMSTWYQTKNSTKNGFARRYGTTLESVISVAEVAMIRSGALFSEWAVLRPTSIDVHKVLSDIRRARGKGGCVALANSIGDAATWHALSIGSLWRAVISQQGTNLPDVNETVLTTYLSEAVANGLFPVVPLDYHPSAGYVVFGRADELLSMANLVPDIEISTEDRAVASIHHAGGGLAL